MEAKEYNFTKEQIECILDIIRKFTNEVIVPFVNFSTLASQKGILDVFTQIIDKPLEEQKMILEEISKEISKLQEEEKVK